MARRTTRERELEAENAALKRAIEQLHRIANLLRDSMDVEAACDAVLTAVTAGVGLGFNRAMLFLTTPDVHDVLRGRMALGPADEMEADRVWRAIEAGAADLATLYQDGREARREPGPLDTLVKSLSVRIESDSPIALALREGTSVRGRGTDDLGGLLHLPTAVAAPLRGPHGAVGVLYADNRFNGRPCDAVIEHVFALVADHAGRAVDNARHFERASKAARTDAMTGLGHHGAFMAALERAIATAKGAPVSLVMLDLDGFKRVNDTWGHLAGDALLAGLAERLLRELRGGQGAFRYGGEEFAVVLPGVDAAGAEVVAERLRVAIASHPFQVTDAQALSVTCSLGVASWAPGQGLAALVDAADQVLLAAKRGGKNRVTLAAPVAVAPPPSARAR